MDSGEVYNRILGESRMAPIFYGSLLVASLVCTAIYICKWHKHFNTNINMIFAFIPISIMGFLYFSVSKNIGEAVSAQKLMYLGSSFLQLFMLLSLFNLCRIEIKKWQRLTLFVLCLLSYVSVLTIGYSDGFYRNMSFSISDGMPVLERDYGWMHTAYYALVIVFFVMGFIAIVYSWLKKRQVPRTIILLLVIPYVIVMISCFAGKRTLFGIDLVPAGYLLAQVMYLIICVRMNLYDVADTAIDSLVHEKAIGYISFDFNYSYLGSNEVAKILVPELNNLAVDEKFGYKTSERRIRHFLEDYKRDPANNKYLYTIHGNDGNPDAYRRFTRLHCGRHEDYNGGRSVRKCSGCRPPSQNTAAVQPQDR